MADGTWTNGVGDQNWADAGNWSGVAAPGDGETATFDGNETDAELPASNQPNDGSTFHFIFTGAYNFPGSTLTIQDDILAGGADVIGHIEVDNASAVIVPGANFGAAGTGATLTDGYLSIEAGPRTCTGDIIVVADNTNGLSINGVTLAVSGGTVEMQADTYLAFFGAAVLDLAEPMRVEGDGNHYIDFNDGGGDIYGGIDASSDGTSRQVLVVNTAGAGANIVQGGVTGDLDLGTDGAGGLADWSAVALFIQTGTVTMAADANVYRLTVISGELVGAAKTITADAGGFTFVNGTISGTLDVDLSGSTGAYTQMDGTIAGEAVLNVTTGSGGFAYTALTKTGTLNVTVTASMTGSWNTGVGGANLIDLLTVNSPATLTADAYLYARALAGTGLVAGATIGLNPTSDNFWTLSGTGSSANIVLRPTTAVSNAALIDIGAGKYTQNKNFTPTLNGGLTCGDILIQAASGATTICNGPLTASGTVTLGYTTSYGIFTLGPNQVHRIGSTIARSGTSNSNAINFGGRVELGGNATLAGITPDFGSAYIVGAKTLPTLDGATAGTVANTAAVIARMTIANLTGPAANKIVAYSHRGERVHFDNRLPAKARDGLNCQLSTGNSNILSRLVVARQPNFIRASSRRVRRCARGTGRGRIALTRKDTIRN